MTAPTIDAEAMPEGFAPCILCGAPNPLERFQIGKQHCMDKECVATWRRRRLETEQLALVFVHKQGLMWVKKDEVKKNDMRRQGGA